MRAKLYSTRAANDDHNLAYAQEWIRRLQKGLGPPPDRAAIAAAIALAVEAAQRLNSPWIKGAISGRDGTWIGLRLQKSLDELLTLDRLPDLVADIVCGDAGGEPHPGSIRILRDCLKGVRASPFFRGHAHAWHHGQHQCLKLLGTALKKILYNAARRRLETSSIEATLRSVIQEAYDRTCNQVPYFRGHGGWLSSKKNPFPHKPYGESRPTRKEQEGIFRAKSADAAANGYAGRYGSEELARHLVSERALGSANAAAAQGVVMTMLPAQPAAKLPENFLDAHLRSQKNMREMLAEFLRTTLQRYPWITREALVRGVQQRFGPTFTVMRRVEAIKSSKARSGAPDRSSAGGESELDQAVSRDPESWDPQEQQDHLAREVYDVLFQLNLEQELQPIVEAIGKEACFPGVLTQEALDAYYDELLDRTVFLGESADPDEAAPLRAALEPVYRRASPGERKLLQRAADKGLLKPILQQLIREQIRKRHAAKQR